MSASKVEIPFRNHLLRSKCYQEALSFVPKPESPIFLRGFAGSLKGLFAGHIFQKHQRQVIVICADNETAIDVWNDITILLPDQRVFFIGEKYSKTHHELRAIESLFAENIDILRAIAENPECVVITDFDTFLSEFPTAKEIKEQTIRIERFSSLKQEELIKRLAYGGFERNDFVSASGEYAVRGGIVDIFPVGFDSPIRIEFFGDEVDSLREFDPINQRSIRQLDSVGFVTTLFLDDENSKRSLMFDYFSSDALLVIEEEEHLKKKASERLSGIELSELIELFSRYCLSVVIPQNAEIIDLEAVSQPAFNSSIAYLKDYLTEKDNEGGTVFLVADSEQQVRRLSDLLSSTPTDDENPEDTQFRYPVNHCPISQGFYIPDIKLSVITEHQIFNRRRIQKSLRKVIKGLSLREMRQLHIGDYVVHVDKGIGRFAGFQNITINDGVQETAKIIYADEDILYVNLNYINRLQKYSSAEGATPKLSKLGSGEWDRVKERTKRRLKDIARDLINLYAKRKMAKGFLFSEDSHWQKEMEASFIYEDTPDQYQATVDVKKDMQEAVPMDRLVCGDVGYGKTEVAMRASFKAVLDGKQVAVLVPTTILAQQHYNAFHDRLHRYSVNVESLSRFKSVKEQKHTLEQLSNGRIDIVIGTHRLISKDVIFKDLGLLIIDEEHRFGVAAKEKLRHLREHVDTLTLTATPIPRTLNFSLLGARDLSVIETPPKNRLPIITSILPLQKDVIIDGVTRELNRNGQVYFVNDRISDLELLADKLRVYVPGVRIGIAHGQMKTSDLERVMMRFLEKKIDVLVTTKIIESGLDIPNANTIFINKADRFGLAELYQLRGRVGRSNIQAYAYLLIPPEEKLTRDALKRLQAIEEFSELGTGFQLSMRDLEIRGAGNLLGAEQSGFIAEIGFDLFMSTLESAVAELKEEEFQELFEEKKIPISGIRPDVVMELGIDAYFPQDFISNATDRFELYKRLYNAEDSEAVKEIENEIFDRFGLFPQEAENLFFIIHMRLLAAQVRLYRVGWDRSQLTIFFPPDDDTDFYERHFHPIIKWIMARQDRMKFEQDRSSIRLIVKGVASQSDVESVLRELAALCAYDQKDNVEQTQNESLTRNIF